MQATVEADGLVALTAYQKTGFATQKWVIEDDWHRLFLAAAAGPDRFRFFVRTQSDPSATAPEVWWLEGAYLMLVTATTDCDSALQYFDNPGNSYGNNFLKARYPENYPFSPETDPPGYAAILTVDYCADADIEVLITVLDNAGKPAREHQLSIRTTEVDWYYNPLFP